jgi:CRP-like cAMP-binding protein
MVTPSGGPALGRDELRSCSLFARMSDAMLDDVARSMRVRRYRAGETIFHQDDPGDSLHIVASGAVKIVLPSSGGEDPAILAVNGPGHFFGGLALLDGAPRSATAVAIGPTTTLVLRREAFLDLVDRDAGLRRALLSTLAAEIRSTTGQVHDLQFLDLPARLARRLLRAVAAAGGATAGGAAAGGGVATPLAGGPTTIRWPFTQTELAGMIGGSRQSVNRLLRDFAARGLIRQERDALVVLDPSGLERVAEL